MLNANFKFAQSHANGIEYLIIDPQQEAKVRSLYGYIINPVMDSNSFIPSGKYAVAIYPNYRNNMYLTFASNDFPGDADYITRSFIGAKGIQGDARGFLAESIEDICSLVQNRYSFLPKGWASNITATNSVKKILDKVIAGYNSNLSVNNLRKPEVLFQYIPQMRDTCAEITASFSNSFTQETFNTLSAIAEEMVITTGKLTVQDDIISVLTNLRDNEYKDDVANSFGLNALIITLSI